MLRHTKKMLVALLLLMMAGSTMCEIVELTQECSYDYRNYMVTGTVGTEIRVKVEPDWGEAEPEIQRIAGTGTYGTATFRWGTGTGYGHLDEYIITVYNTSDPNDSKSITTRLYGGASGFYVKRFIIHNPEIYDNGKIRVGDKVTLVVILMHPCGCSGSKSVTADLTDFGMGSEVDITAGSCEHEGFFFSRSFMMSNLIVPDVPTVNVSIIAADEDGVTACREIMQTVYPSRTPTPTTTPTSMLTPISTPRQTITPTPPPTPTPTVTQVPTPTPTPTVSDKSEEIAMESEEVGDTVDESATDETPPVQAELEVEEVSIPGFAARFAILGLLMIAALFRYRRN